MNIKFEHWKLDGGKKLTLLTKTGQINTVSSLQVPA